MNPSGIVITICFVGLLYFQLYWRKRNYAEHFRAIAESEFHSLSVVSDSQSFEFNGAVAQIIDEKEEIETMRGSILAYSLTRIARNPAGEYFFFKYRSDSNLYFKHLEQGRACMLLGKKYISKSL